MLYVLDDGTIKLTRGDTARIAITINNLLSQEYSSEGYCFWDTMTPENYDEECNLLPLERRLFAQYASTSFSSIDEINEVIFSVPVQPGYEIVSVGKDEEVI